MKINQTDFRSFHKNTVKHIKNELEEFSDRLNKYSKESFPDLEQLNKRFSEHLFGGKMIRGTLVNLGYELFSNTTSDDIYKPAAAFEILHTALLIHDDIIDQSPTRRGKPALHINKNSHYGISQAICLGDLGIAHANKLITETNFSPETKNRALQFFLKIVTDTILGEMLDVKSSYDVERNEKQIIQIHRMKTALYTIIGPLTLGAIFAGATETVLEKIRQFGEPLGIAFQLQDDILGIFGEEAIIGKSTASDIEENKSTILFTYAFDHASLIQKEILKRNYGKKHITKKQQEMIKKVFIDTGSLEYSQKKIEALTAEAKAVIPTLIKDKDKQYLLVQFADLLIERRK